MYKLIFENGEERIENNIGCECDADDINIIYIDVQDKSDDAAMCYLYRIKQDLKILGEKNFLLVPYKKELKNKIVKIQKLEDDVCPEFTLQKYNETVNLAKFSLANALSESNAVQETIKITV